MNIVISGTVGVGKSTISIELEDSKKKLFLKNNDNINFSAEFNHAYDQITSWKAYISKNKDLILNQLEKIRVPLGENDVRFKYVLVIGRRKEKEGSEKRTAMFAEKSTNDIKVMTYDSIISEYECNSNKKEKIILSHYKSQGFKIKKLPKGLIETSLFTYLNAEYLNISPKNYEILKNNGFLMDKWKDGQY